MERNGAERREQADMKAFARYHPAVLFVYFLAVLLIAMFVSNPVLQLCALMGGALFGCMLEKRRELPGIAGFCILMFLLICVTNPLFSHSGVTPLFFLNGNPVTLEAIVYGAAIAVMVIGVLLWCRCYSRIMTVDKQLFLFGRALPQLSLILSMALRFIPLLKRQMHRVSAAQKAMGLYTAQNPIGRLRSAVRVFAALVAWSLENSLDTAASMKARGYGLPERTQFSLFRFGAADGVLLSVCVGLLGLILACTAAGAVRFAYYPRLDALPMSPVSGTVYGAYAVLTLLPFILEVKEALLWKYSVSKI